MTRQNPPFLKKRRGFTLTELMVVIVMIAILALLAFTVGNKMKSKAKAMKCLNRMREWGLVCAAANADLGGGRMYCPDSFSSIGPNGSPFSLYWADMAGVDGGSTKRNKEDLRKTSIWTSGEYVARVAPFMSERRSCPCHPTPRNQYGNPGTSYAMNTFLQDPKSSSNDFEGHKVLRIADIPRLSKKIYLVDTPSDGALSYGSLKNTGKSGFLGELESIAKIHGGRVNALFLDMHIEQLRPEEIESEWNAFIKISGGQTRTR